MTDTKEVQECKTQGCCEEAPARGKLKGFKEVDLYEYDLNAFKAIGKDFMEIVMSNNDAPDAKPNAMTAAWGGLGIMWNKPVAWVVVRGEDYRFSRHLLDREPMFSLCFLGDDYTKAKGYLGSAHGWDDPDKVGSAGLTLGHTCFVPEHGAEEALVHVPFIEESEMVFFCEKVVEQQLPEEGFLDKALWEQHYTTQDEHRLYIAEIRAAYVKE